MKDESTVDILAQKNRIAIVMAPHLGIGEAANRAAVLATGLAAQYAEIIGNDLITADNATLRGFTKVPIALLTAKESSDIHNLWTNAKELNCSTFVFLARAQGVRSYVEYAESIAETPEAELDVDAFLVYGTLVLLNGENISGHQTPSMTA
jgi:hypothetical protein